MDSAPEMQVNRQTIDGAVVVTVIGEVDLMTSPEVLHEVMAGIEEADKPLCILDLTGVTFLGSPGLAMLITASNQASTLGGVLRIVVDSDHPIIQPIQVTGLIDILAFYHSVDDALDADGDRMRQRDPPRR